MPFAIIKRAVLEELRRDIRRKEIAFLIGPRQAGKTTIMQIIQGELEAAGEKTLFLSLDYDYDREYFASQQSLLKKIELELGGGPTTWALPSRTWSIWSCVKNCAGAAHGSISGGPRRRTKSILSSIPAAASSPLKSSIRTWLDLRYPGHWTASSRNMPRPAAWLSTGACRPLPACATLKCAS